MKKEAPRSSAAKKPAAAKPVKAGSQGATPPRAVARPVPPSPRPPARPVRQAVQAAVAAMRKPAPDERVALAPMLTRLDGRLEEIAREFDRAKDSLGEATKARSASLTDRQQQRNLAEHATEMRLLTARRAELLWLRQLLLQDGPSAR